MRIFLIAGKSGSGKHEISKYIKEYYIYKLEESVITGYSKYIKNYALELTDWDGQDGTKPRDFLQKTGIELREINPNFFTRRMIEDIEFYQKHVNNIIIDDVRMPNEIDDIYNTYDNVYSIYVENQFGKSNLTLEQQADVTEVALEEYSDFDYVLVNDNESLIKDKVFKYLESIDNNDEKED